MALEIKICGLTSPEAVSAAVQAGADMIGFVFFARSPRNVTVETATSLAGDARGRVGIVALVVDADDRLLSGIVDGLRPDLLQLHGSETPARAAEIRQRFGVPVMKALKIATAADLAPVKAFAPHVDRFLFDAKAPPTLANPLPGGNGISFDWRLVAGLDAGRPAMLSGGLDTANVADAIRLTGMRAIDVSSGVERRPGEKDPQMIKAFIAAARAAL
jgi:phosphoribosylanthranilate isomerase